MRAKQKVSTEGVGEMATPAAGATLVRSHAITDEPCAPAYPSAIARPGGARPRAFKRILSLDDFEPAARRHLPRFLFGYIAGGVETNATREANRRAFAVWGFRTRVLVGTTGRSQQTLLFGHPYAAPFGIAPMGGTALASFKADVALARAASASNVPFVLSGFSLVPLEEVIRANPNAWFQAYLPGDRARIAPLVERVARAGYGTLVITADVAVSANRENNLRNGWASPLRPSARLAFDTLVRPGWLWGTFLKTLARSGMPHLENLGATRGVPVLSPTAKRLPSRRDALSWDDIGWVRERWQGKLVVKGVLSADDVRIGREAGLDGVIISNHGGRQLDFSAASLPMLAEAKSAAGAMTLMVDGGFRRGTDILKAFAFGAHFVFVGRPFYYAVAIGGEAAVFHGIALLSEEIDRDLAMLGCNSVAELGPGWLVPMP
ncbi:MAG: alpha-hydroxy acid oxidase [Acetobacteraceae bacterium]